MNGVLFGVMPQGFWWLALARKAVVGSCVLVRAKPVVWWLALVAINRCSLRESCAASAGVSKSHGVFVARFDDKSLFAWGVAC